MRRTAAHIILFLIPVLCVAQFDYQRELPSRELDSGDVRFSVSGGISKFVTTRNRFLESKASLRFAAGPWEYGLFIRLNNQVDFELPGSSGSLDISQDQIIFIDPNLLLHNQSYSISKPVSFFATRHLGMVDLTVDLSPVFRSERIWTPIISRLDSATYSITTYEDLREQADFVTGILASTSVGPLIVFGGASSVSLAQVGDERVIRSNAVPVFGAGLRSQYSWINCITNFSEWRVQHLQELSVPWTADASSYLRAQLFLNERQFSSRGGAIDLTVPVTERLQLNAGFTSVWTKTRSFSSQDLQHWYSSVSPPWDENMETRLPHSSLTFGVQYDLRKGERRSAVQLLKSEFLQTDIYFAKREFYAYNPVAEITVRNMSGDASECQFMIDMEGGTGSYRSDRLRLAPDETRTLPLFLYLADATMQTPAELRQLKLSVTERGRTWDLTSASVTLHEAHHWDGDTKNLRFFLAPEDPQIIAAARRSLLSFVSTDSSLTLQQNMIASLKHFITETGKNLRYVSDPTTTLTTDRVQFPSETMELQAGDCEDLVVYVASCLMSVGYQCAVVDLNPAQRSAGAPGAKKEIGHVFLLVDTGIGTENASGLGLSDIEWTARRSMDGRTTIWLPIETSMLQNGFERAFKAGVSQYYQFVISPSELKATSVRVIDF
jgi:hypothetical protein